MPDEPRPSAQRIAAILLVGFGLLTLLTLLLSLPADAQALHGEMANDSDPFTYDDGDSASTILLPPAYSWIEIHGDVVCMKDANELFQCGVAPTFGHCPDGYRMNEYENGWPTTCWPEADGGGDITISGVYGEGSNLPDHWVFNRLTTSTDVPAQAGSIHMARAPYVAQSDRPHVSADCGPAWLGGCFHLPHRALADVVTDCHFWCFTVGLVGATALDYAVTAHGLADGRCIEHNPNIGQHPTAGTFAKDFSETHLPVIALGLLIQKTVPRHPTTTPQRIATWIYPAMASYGMAIHASGAASWLGRCW